ncbi:MAG: Gfo/Idh/MocA family protein, partial [Woeseiaceae bacterium]
MNPIRTAIIGVGRQGRRHAEKLDTLENSRLVAVCDIDAGRCEAAGSQLGVAALASFQTLLGEVDAVVVATPTPTHFEIAGTCLANGIHVLLEKPITASIDEARRLVS